MPAAGFATFTYKVPRIIGEGLFRPRQRCRDRRLRRPSPTSYRVGLEQFATVTAASVTAPSLTGTHEVQRRIQGGAGSGEFTYSDFAMEGIKDGKIATTKASEAVFTINISRNRQA